MSRKELDIANLQALKKACGMTHESGYGGAAICICGHACGGSPACSGLSILKEFIRYYKPDDPNWEQQREFLINYL